MRLLISLALSCFALVGLGAQLFASEKPPDFRVTIIAVTHFEDPKLSGPDDKDLNDANAEAASSLKNYFESNFIVPVELYTVPRETSQDFLHNWLFQDLRHDSQKGVHLVFVLTHGFADEGSDPTANKSELYLATSDTYVDDIPGKAIRGGDFIVAFQGMPSRATVFLFLDTCGSGAIDSENLYDLLQQEPEFASRVMILAAANSDEYAYRARFTKALLSIWQSKHPTKICGQFNIEQSLTAALKQIPGISPDVKQTVRVVAPLSPYFCIDSFSYAQRFVMLYNATPRDVAVTLEASDRPDSEREITLHHHQMAPVSELRPTSYQMVAQRKLSGDQADKSSNDVETIDLTSVPAKVVVLFSSDPLDDAQAKLAAANYLNSRGILASFTDGLIRSSSESALRASSLLRDEQASVTTEDINANRDARMAKSNLEDAKKLAMLRRRDLEAALSKLNQPHSASIDDDLRHAVDQAREQLAAVQTTYSRAQEQAHQMDMKLQQIDAVKSRLETGFQQIAMLQQSTHNLVERKANVVAVERAVSTALKPVFPDVRVNSRGVQVMLPGISAESEANIARLRKFVEVSNEYPKLDVEIELLQGGESSIANQVSIRSRAMAFKNALWRLGLESGNVVARGFILPGSHTLVTNLILSQP